VFVLVGPAGVGKTTTIAKLAAMYGAVADPPFDVRILTIDTYRIGALQQIQKYGEIMSIPVHAVESADDMRKQLDIHSDADFIFIDTIGKSPNDFGKLAEVNQMVRSTGGEVHLAVSATTKRSDIEEIIRQFEPFNYQAVVVTKMDETSSVGGIISAIQERQKSVSFVTDGQSVPQDIERARPDSFLRRLHNLPGIRPILADNKTGVI
jgi:flagellar biosynthesis protein FlhF